MGFIDKFKDKIDEIKNTLSNEKEPLDLTQFNDPLAETIEWHAAKPGGTNICTHRLSIKFDNTAVFKATFAIHVFTGVFIFLGLLAVIGPFIGMAQRGGFKLELLIPVTIGTVFCVLGTWMNRTFTAPVTFDLDSGYFWKGRKSPSNSFNVEEEIKEYAQIKDIHALQLLSEYCRGDKSSYYSYELNLILNDGTRINVVEHGNLKKLRDDAEELAKFLNVPLWDIT